MARRSRSAESGNPIQGHDNPSKVSAVLLTFAEPLVDRRDTAVTEAELRTLLDLAVLVWNAETLRAQGRGDGGLDELLEKLRHETAPEPRGMARVIELLIERKRRHFGAHVHLIGEWHVFKSPETGDLRVRVEARGLGAAPRSPGTKRARAPKSLVVDLRDVVDADGLRGYVSESSRRLVAFFGEVVAGASPLAAGLRHRAEVPCRRRTGAKRCKEELTIFVDDVLEWECPGCAERGTISHWRGSPWDIVDRSRRLVANPGVPRLELNLSTKEMRALEDAPGLDVLGLGALLAAERSGKHWRLTATREELESLACAAIAEECSEFPPLASVSFASIHARIHATLGTDPHTQLAATTADILCHRAREQREHLRSVPHLDRPTAHRLSAILEEVEPLVRRELVVASDTTLEELHCLLQVAFGWSESHLHAFRIGPQGYMRGDQSEGIDARPTNGYRLLDVVPTAGMKLRYEYDFGDSWTHAIVVTSVDPFDATRAVPACLYGEGAAPPEDCGGVGGYEELQRVLADPADEEHEHYREWVGIHFDPQAFDLAATNRMLARFGNALRGTRPPGAWPVF